MQKVVYVNYGGYSTNPLRELNELLSQGWNVVMMQPFSQVVSVSTTGKCGDSAYSAYRDGAYGTTFVLEKAR